MIQCTLKKILFYYLTCIEIKMRLEFVKQNGEVRELNIREVSRFSMAQYSCVL